MFRFYQDGGETYMNDINWTGHLDVMFFIILFYPLAVEYLKWRLGI